MKIGIFGGRFDPIHIGHLIVAQDVLETLRLDKVLFLVSYHPPHKEAVASFEDRYEMVLRAIQDFPYFTASDLERRLNLEKSYTANVLPHLQSLGELYFFMGVDQYRTFPEWYNPEKILSLARIVVFERPGVSREPNPYDSQVLFVHVRQIQISASEIRQRIREGRPYRLFVPAGVADYIEQQGLYKT